MIDLPAGRCKHFSFLIKKNRIISIGWNNGFKTHPLANKYGHRFCSIHSELHCISSFKNTNGLILVNVRIDSNGKLKCSKPCGPCQKMLIDFNITNIFYTTEKGFEFCQFSD